MDIREATIEDAVIIYDMGTEFAKESGLIDKLGIDEGSFFEWIKTWFDNPNADILLLEGDETVGFIACMLSPHYINRHHIVAHELAWWVKPEFRKGSGVKLLRAFEDWAKERGASSMVVSSIIDPEGSRLDAFYKKSGYTVSEISYIKEV